jgi:hypothetical protein
VAHAHRHTHAYSQTHEHTHTHTNADKCARARVRRRVVTRPPTSRMARIRLRREKYAPHMRLSRAACAGDMSTGVVAAYMPLATPPCWLSCSQGTQPVKHARMTRTRLASSAAGVAAAAGATTGVRRRRPTPSLGILLRLRTLLPTKPSYALNHATTHALLHCVLQSGRQRRHKAAHRRGHGHQVSHVCNSLA